MIKTTTVRTIEIALIDAENPIEVADGAIPAASMAIEQFKAGRDIEIPYEDDGVIGTGYIPYHSVLYIIVSEEKTSETIEDAFCAEE